jgi:hypothetical protein
MEDTIKASIRKIGEGSTMSKETDEIEDSIFLQITTGLGTTNIKVLKREFLEIVIDLLNNPIEITREEKITLTKKE